MSEELIEKISDLIDGQIDFEGQRLADWIVRDMLIFSAVLAFVLGFWRQDIRLALYIGLGGTALTFLVAIPPWPSFRRHPVLWYGQQGAQAEGEKPSLS